MFGLLIGLHSAYTPVKRFLCPPHRSTRANVRLSNKVGTIVIAVANALPCTSPPFSPSPQSPPSFVVSSSPAASGTHLSHQPLLCFSRLVDKNYASHGACGSAKFATGAIWKRCAGPRIDRIDEVVHIYACAFRRRMGMIASMLVCCIMSTWE